MAYIKRALFFQSWVRSEQISIISTRIFSFSLHSTDRIVADHGPLPTADPMNLHIFPDKLRADNCYEDSSLWSGAKNYRTSELVFVIVSNILPYSRSNFSALETASSLALKELLLWSLDSGNQTTFSITNHLCVNR